jgi:hypothetical protein
MAERDNLCDRLLNKFLHLSTLLFQIPLSGKFHSLSLAYLHQAIEFSLSKSCSADATFSHLETYVVPTRIRYLVHHPNLRRLPVFKLNRLVDWYIVHFVRFYKVGSEVFMHVSSLTPEDPKQTYFVPRIYDKSVQSLLVL